MKRNQLSDVAVFVEVARAKGFRAAADRLKLKPGSVSEAVQRFEDRLGVRLFERSTRSVVLTPIGERLYERSLPAIDDLEAAVQELDDSRETVSGVLRLSAPYSAGPFFLDELIGRFVTSYSGVDVHLIYNDKKVDLLESRIDAAIRSNTLLEPDTHAVPIGPELRMSVVASASYLEKHGAPTAPKDLVDHDGICFAFGRTDELAPWTFSEKDRAFSVMPKPHIIANDLRSLVAYAKAGLGLAYVYSEVAAPDVEDGSLVEVLTEHVPTMPRYSLNYRSKKHMTPRLRAFIDLSKSTKR